MKRKRTMLVRVSYLLNGREINHSVAIDFNSLIDAEREFNCVVRHYQNDMKEHNLVDLRITSELVFETRPLKFYFSEV